MAGQAARRRLRDHVRLRLTLIAAASYAALFGILLSQALRGHPVLAPDPLTLTLLAGWVLATVVAAAAGARRRLPARRPAVISVSAQAMAAR